MNDIIKLVDHLTGFILALHALCMLFINFTKTPNKVPDGTLMENLPANMYRVIELFAGLFTPLAKR